MRNQLEALSSPASPPDREISSRFAISAQTRAQLLWARCSVLANTPIWIQLTREAPSRPELAATSSPPPPLQLRPQIATSRACLLWPVGVHCLLVGWVAQGQVGTALGLSLVSSLETSPSWQAASIEGPPPVWGPLNSV